MFRKKQKQFWKKCEDIVRNRVEDCDEWEYDNTQAKILWGVIAISIVFWGGIFFYALPL